MEGSNLLRIKMKLTLVKMKMNNKIKKVKKIHPKVHQALDFAQNVFISFFNSRKLQKLPALDKKFKYQQNFTFSRDKFGTPRKRSCCHHQNLCFKRFLQFTSYLPPSTVFSAISWL